MRTVANSREGRPLSGPRLVTALVLGNALEFYDFSTYAFITVSIGRVFFPAGEPWTALLLATAVFGVGFLARPIGAIIIGFYADRRGRRPALTLTIGLMAVGLLILALTPGYASIGMAGPTLIVLARLIQGFALGGEVGASTALLLELAPAGRRSLYTAWQLASQGGATLAAGLLGLGLTLCLPQAAMEQWGWRLLLLPGLAILPAGLYLRRCLPADARPAAGTASLVRDLARQRRTLLVAVPVLLCGTVTTFTTNYMTTYALTILRMPPAASIAVTAMVGGCVLVFALAGGWLADRVGRRPVMLLPRLALALLAYPCFALMLERPGAAAMLAASGLLAALGAVSGAASLTAITELLPSPVRAGGLAMVYGLTISLFGGTTQFIITWLTQYTGDPISPAYYLIITSLIGLIAMVALPETRPEPSAAPCTVTL
ncbi:MFS transporter [Nitrospirillum sp. BR 11752]|uniref:MFS transporter n=1 Tax=Nitrospirillum sp. BR 11752 TaxID=3104293 RepID=UPI002E9C174F|nr:MFS transporter [Nitrospirillum sp. BR 11752]